MADDGVAGGEAEVVLGEGGEISILLEIVRLVCVRTHKEGVHTIAARSIDERVDAQRFDERGFEARRLLAAGLLQIEFGREEPTIGSHERGMFVAGTLPAVDLLQCKTEIAIREVRIAFPLQRQRTDVGVLVDADKLL